jgi:hypothetical protein
VLRRLASFRRRKVLVRIGPPISQPQAAEQVRQVIICLGEGRYQPEAETNG